MWTEAELKQALQNDHVYSQKPYTGLSMDSRTTRSGDLFIAIKGDAHDGHDYVEAALSNGAEAAIVMAAHNEIPAAKQIVVASSQKAMDALAAFARNRTTAQIAAVTGSAGKTTVKEFLAHVFKNFGETVYSRASYNNAIGVPYSVAHLEASTQYAVFELGMNNPGEISPLAHLVRPHIGIITNIGESHIGHMGSILSIVEEKSEILRALNANDTAILPLDTPHFDTLHKKAKSFGLSNILTFGKGADATAKLVSFTPDKDGSGSIVVACIHGKNYTYTLHIPGEHSALNSLIVILACTAFGLVIEDVLPHMQTFKPVQGRGLRHTLPFKKGYITLIDDAYNANPSSMRAGLSVLAMTQPHGNGRRIAVLGDMKELGAGSAEYHKALALMIDSLGIDLIFASGTEMKHLYNQLSPSKRGGYSETVEALIPRVMAATREDDIIFVKGSKSSYISKVVDAFLKC
ncbi:MAG: UDP-N-acetylmuramoyl-tripeptide--D-alanyl-D-alanine ligase [Alphaproteobacteria bacterium]|nr:UDP-N-acetylmuramoyl-tripeptide--D-alanyl-D-alanine ligase [Alphaproteobacteria bacterium]